MKLERKRKTKVPCPGCGLFRSLCLCAQIPTLSTKTKISLIIHYKELKKPTNTGQLAVKSLTNSEIRIRGELGKDNLDLSDLLTDQYRTYLFYPSDDAVELNKELVQSSELPIQLIVPDGNWRQASKVFTRHAELKNLIKVKISAPNTNKQHIRAEHFPNGMSTLEAIAHALGIIEGPLIMEPLIELYRIKLERTLIGRGIKTELPLAT